jgi:tetratricopeptide (TPR) repeat protein
MKKSILIILFSFFFIVSYSQKLLKVVESAISIYSNDQNNGLYVISCDSALNLSFKTNWTEKITFLKEPGIEAGKRVYSLLFPMDSEWSGRILFISTSGYETLSLKIPLEPNIQKVLSIEDPNAKIIGCYYQLTKDALDLFQSGMYEEAKTKYLESMKCDIDYFPEYELEVRAKIALIDSIQLWNTLANAFMAGSDYVDAIKNCQKILEKNSKDEYNKDR